MSWACGRRLRTRMAGAFLFLPLLARLRLDPLVEHAGYPGSAMVPAASALLSLLALKLLNKERRSHVNDWSFDEALARFAGLNVLPQKSFLTAFSQRGTRAQQRARLAGWVGRLSGLLFEPDPSFSLDFHPIPDRGEASGRDRHSIPLSGKASPRVLRFFALEQDSRVLCYANADLTRAEQAGEVLRFVAFWHELTGADPAWLYVDSKVTTYPELCRLSQRGISFVTIRRRGAAVVRRRWRLPGVSWQKAVIDTPKRCHPHVRYIDESIELRGQDGALRQVAVDGLGKEQPTLRLSNNSQETARNLVIRYAGRNRREDGLGQCVNFFPLDGLASEVRLNVDWDAALTVLARGCYRWLGKQVKGFDQAASKQLSRRLVESAGTVEVAEGRVAVPFDRRSPNPSWRAAALDGDAPAIPWLQGRKINFFYS